MESDLKRSRSLMSSDVNNSHANSMLTSQEKKQRRRAIKCKSEGVAFMRLSLDPAHAVIPTSLPFEEMKKDSRLETLSELVHVPAKVSSHCFPCPVYSMVCSCFITLYF